MKFSTHEVSPTPNKSGFRSCTVIISDDKAQPVKLMKMTVFVNENITDIEDIQTAALGNAKQFIADTADYLKQQGDF